jgi:hypothetical protein
MKKTCGEDGAVAQCSLQVFCVLGGSYFSKQTKTARRFSASGCDASGGIRTHTGVSPTDFESVTSASSITLAGLLLLDYLTQICRNCQALK